MKTGNKQKKKWIRTRHRVTRILLTPAFRLHAYFKYGMRIERFREQGNRPYLVLFNHQTGADQFFVDMTFRGSVYFIATEDIFSKGLLSSLLRYLVAPIPIKKQTTDLRAILTCIRVAKEGGTIAIAPEGNRTYSGKTEYMSPSIAPLARKLGLPIALLRLEGGYGVQPRWSDVVRRGRMVSHVTRVIEPEEYATLSDDELFALIRDGLYVDEANDEHTFKHKKCAEYLERAAYVCPDCGLSTFESHRDTITCKSCHKTVRYTKTTELEGVDCQFPFRFFNDWYEYQKEFILSLDLTPYLQAPMYRETAMLAKVVPYVKKEILDKHAEIALYGDRITVSTADGERVFSFDQATAVTVLGKNKLNVYINDEIFQFKGDKRFNALKYVHIYHRYKNLSKGDPDGKFLGL